MRVKGGAEIALTDVHLEARTEDGTLTGLHSVNSNRRNEHVRYYDIANILGIEVPEEWMIAVLKHKGYKIFKEM